MSPFGKINLIVFAVLFSLSCSLVLAQEKQVDKQKDDKPDKQKQEDVFDASNATLEQAQNWLKKNLVKYGKFGRSRVESVKFKGCELSYSNNWGSANFQDASERYNTMKPIGIETTPERGKNIETMTATDFRTFLSGYSERGQNVNVNLKGIDADKSEIVEKGKIFVVTLYSAPAAKKDSIETATTEKTAPTTTHDKFPGNSTQYSGQTSVSFLITNRQVANQVKDALVRVITLCK